MSLAAFQMAFQERKRSRLVYFQTEGGRSALHHYRFTDTGMLRLEKSEEITKTITLDDYLRLHVGSYAQGDLRDEFEQKVHEALRRIDGLEILTSVRPEELDALEIDFVIRLGNQVGVIETKTKAAKKGIDQIQAVAEQRYLGTYVSKFLVSGQPLDKNNKQLAKAYNIAVVETDYTKAGCLRPEDVERLIDAVQSRMGRKT